MKVNTPRATDWTEEGTSTDNAADTITHAAVTDSQHYLTHISASSDEAAFFLLTIKDDTTIIWRHFVNTSVNHEFATPLRMQTGNKILVDVAAAGSGIATNCTIAGFSQ